MTRHRCTRLAALLAALTTVVAACGGSSSTPTCTFDTLSAYASASPWPSFRANPQNTGSVVNADAEGNSGHLRWVFPPFDEPAKGGFVASPVLNNAGTLVYIGSNDGWMYAIDAASGARSPFNLSISQAISGSAMLAVRNGADAVYFGGGDGRLYAVDASAATQATGFPYPIGNYIRTTPVLLPADGSVYVTSQDGTFVGVCPNAYLRFGRGVGATSSSPAIGPELVMYFGTDAGQLRALRYDNFPRWTFTASGPVTGAPVAEVDGGSTKAIYFADRGGRVFKVDANGQPVQGFTVFGPVGPISASPALAGGRLYVASEDGNLYAIDVTSGAAVWSEPFATGAPIFSSPAVATGGDAPMIVFGADDGFVYFLRDEGSLPELVAAFEIGSPVRSSPAIGSDGTVYVGGQDGRVYALR